MCVPARRSHACITRTSKLVSLGACAFYELAKRRAKREGARILGGSHHSSPTIRKTNNFGKFMFRQNVGLFSKVGSARTKRARCAQRVAPPWSSFGYRRPRCGPRATACAPTRKRCIRRQGRAQTSNVDGSVVNARSTVPGREANTCKLNVDDVES